MFYSIVYIYIYIYIYINLPPTMSRWSSLECQILHPCHRNCYHWQYPLLCKMKTSVINNITSHICDRDTSSYCIHHSKWARARGSDVKSEEISYLALAWPEFKPRCLRNPISSRLNAGSKIGLSNPDSSSLKANGTSVLMIKTNTGFIPVLHKIRHLHVHVISNR